jgi:serine/threonine protein kinase
LELKPGTHVDRYQVEALLGRGGMGEVYRVRHRELGTLHALKLLHTGGEELQARLVQEGRIQGGLQHPGVLRVTDLVAVEGRPALVLEYVEGCSLAELLERERLGPEQIDWLALRLLQAVAAAHRHGLIHRDLKPGNILLAEVDGSVQPKVADFGLAKILSDSERGLTATAAVMGTPAYMAPEQYKDARRVDARADVFALGAILYEVVTGRRAFEGVSAPDILWKTVSGDFPPLRSLAPEAPEAWVRAIEGALVADPGARIPSAEALLEIWGQEARAPAWQLPAREGLMSEPPTGLHPTLEMLLDSARDSSVQAHLDDCAACRVELNLYQEVFDGSPQSPQETRPPRADPSGGASAGATGGATAGSTAGSTAGGPGAGSRRWVSALAGAGLGLLGALAVLTGSLGGIGRLNLLGPWWPPLLLITALGGGRMGVGLRALQDGQRVGLWSWLLAPAGLAALGMLACGTGAIFASAAVAAAPVDVAPRLIASGAAVTLRAWSSSLLLAAPLLLATIGLAVWARRPASAASAFDPWTAGLAIGGGGLLWLAEAMLAPDRTATLLIYAVAVAAGCLAALLPAEGPQDTPGRLLGAAAAALACTAAALGVQIQDLHGLFDRAMAAVGVPSEGVASARAFVESWGRALNPWTLAWIALGLAVGALCLLRGRGARPGPAGWRSLALGTLAVAALTAPVGAWNVQQTRGLVDQIVPAWEASAVASMVPALHLRQEGGAVVAAASASAPLAPGDRLVALDDRTVTEMAALIEQLAQLPREAPVPVTLEREGRLLSLSLAWGDAHRHDDKQ